MKSTATTLTLLVAFLTMLDVKSVRAQAQASENKPPESINVVTTSIHSTIMSEDRSVIIHLPRNYSKDAPQKYPVMYVLDGTSQDGHTTDKLSVLSDAGLVPAAI